MSNSDLVRLTEAAQMLAEARTLPDIRKVHNMAQRAQDYAKAARLGLDAQNSAAAIALEAEAKAGELLARMAEAGERRGPADGKSEQVSSQSTPAPATLEDLGITRNESATWQAVASVPATVRAEYVLDAQEREQEVTRVGLLRHAGVKPAKATDLRVTDAHRKRFPDLAAAELSAEVAKAIAATRTDLLAPERWAERIAEMRPEDIEGLRSKVAHIHRWADAWDALLEPRPLSVVGGTRP